MYHDPRSNKTDTLGVHQAYDDTKIVASNSRILRLTARKQMEGKRRRDLLRPHRDDDSMSSIVSPGAAGTDISVRS